MVAKPGPKKKSGNIRRSAGAGEKNRLISELEDRVAALEKELRSKQGNDNSVNDVERQRAAEALCDSESRFRQLSESLPQLVWTCRPDGPCDYLSPQWVSYTGIPEDVQLGYGWLDQVHPDDRERVSREWTSAAAHGDVFDIEFRIRRYDGAYRWFKTRAIPLKDRAGALVKWFGSNTDIDDMKRAEENLAYLASFPEINPSPVFEIGEDNIVSYCNPATRGLFPGIESKGIKHPLLSNIMAMRASLVNGTQNHLVRDIELNNVTYQIAIHYLPEHKATRVYMINITERRRAEEALRESEERFRNLADNIPNPAWMADADGDFYWYNKRWYDYTGTTLEEMRGWGWQKVHHPDYVESVTVEWQSKLKLGQSFEKIFPLRGKDGNYRWFLTRAVPIKDADGKVVRWMGTNTDITERKLAEEALRESKAHMSSIFRAAPTGIGVVVDRVIKETNNLLCEMTGYTREELLGKSARIFYPSDEDYEYVGREKYGQISRMGTGAVETRWRRKDGRVIDILLSSTPLDPDNLKAGVTFTALDITERKRAEDALRESEERYKLVATGSHSAIWDWDVSNKRVFFSPRWKTLHGLSDDEVTDHEEEWSSRIHPEDAPRVMAAVRAHFEGRTPFFAEEYRTRRKDGSWLWISDRGMAQWDAAGRVVRMAGSENDISERKRAEEALWESREKYRELVENANSIILKEDQDGNITFFNEFAQRFFGYSEAEIIGRNALGTIVPMSDSAGRDLTAMLDDLLRHPEKYRTNTHQNMRKNGELVWVAWTNKAIYDDKGNLAGLFSVGIDITQLKRAEEALKDAKMQAELYLDLMGHDISNMHQIIMGHLELAHDIMEMDGKLEGDKLELIDTSMVTLRRSAQLIENIQNIQKLRAGEYKTERMDLCHVVNEVIKGYSNIPGVHISISYTPASDCHVIANPLLRDVFNNVLDNAIKHSIDPVRIGVDISRVARNGCDFYQVTVEDNGPGIPNGKKHEIFDRLKRGDTMARGTGLGLYIVKTLVEAFGGIVYVEDRVPGSYDKGARFIVQLPVAGDS